MPAHEIIRRCIIDRWTPQSLEGYQRLPEENRLSERARGSAVRYLMREFGCFPASILLNVRNEIIFQETTDLGCFTLGDLVINDDERLWIIDGQHRVEALKRAIEKKPIFESYPVIVSIMQIKDKFDELMLFYFVNKRQRSVPTDLAYRHLQRMLWVKGQDWLYEQEGRRGVRLSLAAEVVDRLNEDDRSPWKGKIRRVAEDRLEKHIIRDKPVIRSVVDILRDKVFEGLSIRELSDLLIDFWAAVHNVYPKAFESPRSYTLLATPGIYSLHMLFPNVYSECAREGIVTQRGMERILKKLLEQTPKHAQPEFRCPVDLDFWSKEHGPLVANSTSLKTIRVLYLGLLEKIKLGKTSKTG